MITTCSCDSSFIRSNAHHNPANTVAVTITMDWDGQEENKKQSGKEYKRDFDLLIPVTCTHQVKLH